MAGKIHRAPDCRPAYCSAYPEMAQVRETYANVIGKYNLIKNQLKIGQLEKALAKKFGSAEVWKNVKQLIPPELQKEITSFARASQVIRLVQRYAPWIIGGGLVVGGIRGLVSGL